MEASDIFTYGLVYIKYKSNTYLIENKTEGRGNKCVQCLEITNCERIPGCLVKYFQKVYDVSCKADKSIYVHLKAN
jgi:hypothetical protein